MATRGAAQQVSTRMTKGVYRLVLHKITETKGRSVGAQTQAASTEHQQIISQNRIERNNIDRIQQVSILGCSKIF